MVIWLDHYEGKEVHFTRDVYGNLDGSVGVVGVAGVEVETKLLGEVIGEIGDISMDHEGYECGCGYE